jgi:hypothetical protein
VPEATAAAASAVLKIAKQHAGTIDLLLTDVVLPGIYDREVAESAPSAPQPSR